ncbi:primary-amine oxidase [Hyphomicrobium sp. MC1]|uniref:primary-amine oxidase n=1 Tax=Hyphomicrobium sp. (strain MC1) TaxID=717785 RepID=UPI000213F92F|nr:primary-amine oxidase [Hyphomicrobium sp. MC1]CCB63649.1 Primary amine oxidase [Hyphomicrobium sp. MC1]
MSESCCSTAVLEKSSLVRHPLDPLSPDEIRNAAGVVKVVAPYGPKTCFESIGLDEPTKDELKAYAEGKPVERRAAVNASSSETIGVTKFVVSLDTGKVLFREDCPDKRPMIQLEQFLAIEDIVRGNTEFIAACAKRGITDMSKVCVDPWSAGSFDIPGEEGRHLCHVFCWLRLREFENFYAHPIEGLNAVVDINSGEVIRIDDYGVTPIPMAEYNYEHQFFDEFQPPAKPINVVQPEGVNFKIEGSRLTWRNWALNIGFNTRESLTLHDISFNGRPILRRASIVEMTVPYGSPDAGHFRKHVFDIGEYGIGKLANSLELGCDCLGVIKYLDAHLNTRDGEPWTIKKAICIHEEDSGLLWKHTDFRTERFEIRRGAKLVISSICTVGNYEYALYWYFFLDGKIEFELKATGIINTTACIPGQPGKYGREVAPGVVGQIHQHILCARLEMCVDGDKNSFVECNTYAEQEDGENPYGNAFYEQETLIKTEGDAARTANLGTQRYWKVINPNKFNRAGTPVGYKLDAPDCLTSFVAPNSFSGKRASFTQNHVWVSAYDPTERFPAGEFMNHSDGSGDIKSFVAKNRSIENTDIVLWHTFGLHHSVRPEDFPVQPCISAGFKLMPSGFFDGNPAINLPPVVNAASCYADTGK